MVLLCSVVWCCCVVFCSLAVCRVVWCFMVHVLWCDTVCVKGNEDKK